MKNNFGLKYGKFSKQNYLLKKNTKSKTGVKKKKKVKTKTRKHSFQCGRILKSNKILRG